MANVELILFALINDCLDRQQRSEDAKYVFHEQFSRG